MAKKTKKSKMGRPSKGPTVAVNMRLSERLASRIDRMRRKVEKELSRTAAIEKVLEAGFEKEAEILEEIARSG